MTASILFTLWNKNQESRRSSVDSETTTTVSVEDFDQQNDTNFQDREVRFGEPSSGSIGNADQGNVHTLHVYIEA